MPGAVLAEGDAVAVARAREYSDELRVREVGLCFESNRPLAHVAHELGIDEEALRRWVREAEVDRGPSRSRLYLGIGEKPTKRPCSQLSHPHTEYIRKRAAAAYLRRSESDHFLIPLRSGDPPAARFSGEDRARWGSAGQAGARGLPPRRRSTFLVAVGGPSTRPGAARGRG